MVINNSYIVMHSAADWARFPQIKSAIDAAAAADIGMVFAAQNSAQSNDAPATAAYPASYASPNIVSVGAVDASDHISSVSNFGNAVHIAAPGVGINMVLNTGQIGIDLEGTQGFTSFATAHVTAAAAMYWSQNPTATFAQVKASLVSPC
jgi:subtilisin family serine protease